MVCLAIVEVEIRTVDSGSIYLSSKRVRRRYWCWWRVLVVGFWLDILFIVDFVKVAEVGCKIDRWWGGGVVRCCVGGWVRHDGGWIW